MSTVELPRRGKTVAYGSFKPALIALLLEHGSLTEKEISKTGGFKSRTYVNRMLKELIEEGSLERYLFRPDPFGPRAGYVYRLTRVRLGSIFN